MDKDEAIDKGYTTSPIQPKYEVSGSISFAKIGQVLKWLFGKKKKDDDLIDNEKQ